LTREPDSNMYIRNISMKNWQSIVNYLHGFLDAVDGIRQQTADFIIIVHIVSVSNAHEQNVSWQTRQLLASHTWPHVYNRKHTVILLRSLHIRPSIWVGTHEQHSVNINVHCFVAGTILTSGWTEPF